MLLVDRFLLLCAIWLLLSFAPAEASTGEEAIIVRPLLGPAGQTVTVNGTGWQEHFRVGWDVPIWIGFANVVAHGHPDVNGEFSVSFTIPLSTPEGDVKISAIIGNGGGADAIYKVSSTQPPNCFNTYFIGLHGTNEGPDVLNYVPFVSKTIGETWKKFYSRAKENGVDNIKGCAFDYAGSVDDLLTGAVDGAMDGAVDALDRYIRDEVLSTCPTQSIVLAGYSLGAWIIDDWIRRNEDICLSRSASDCEDVSPNIIAVELYGDPLWHRKGYTYLGGPVVTYDGVARRLGLNPPDGPDPYTDTRQGHIGLSGLWQSRCLHRDPVCGEGYRDTLIPRGFTVRECPDSNCKEHAKYAFYPTELDPPVALGTSCIDLPKEDLASSDQTGYGLTQRGAEFLAMKALPEALRPGEAPHPKIVFAEIFREAEQRLVFFRLFFTDPNNDAMGFGFRGINGSGWAEESHPFSDPSYGRVSPGRIEYPFNMECGTASAYESDVEAWIYDKAGQRGPSLTIHLACSAPSEVVTPFPVATSLTQ